MLTRAALLADLERIHLCGRGGAGLPVRHQAPRPGAGAAPVLVVNLSEGEPASAKDSALALTRPHLVLDGVVATARALAGREVHVVLPGERPRAAAAMRSAMAERSDPVPVLTRTAEPRFVAGQAQAVVELLAGRPNLPRTTWAPEAVSGPRGPPDPPQQRRDLGQDRPARSAWRPRVRPARDAHRAGSDAADRRLAGLGPGGPRAAVRREGARPGAREAARQAGAGRRFPRLVGDLGHGRQPATLGAPDAVAGDAARCRGAALARGRRLPGGLHATGGAPTSPGRARDAAGRVSTGCRPSPSAVDAGRARAAAAPAGWRSSPAWWYVVARAPTPTAPSGWCGPCWPRSPARWPPTRRRVPLGRTSPRPAELGGGAHEPHAELRVDWPECRARGLCHEVLPELMDLDEWGYPIDARDR